MATLKKAGVIKRVGSDRDGESLVIDGGVQVGEFANFMGGVPLYSAVVMVVGCNGY